MSVAISGRPEPTVNDNWIKLVNWFVDGSALFSAVVYLTDPIYLGWWNCAEYEKSSLLSFVIGSRGGFYRAHSRVFLVELSH